MTYYFGTDLHPSIADKVPLDERKRYIPRLDADEQADEIVANAYGQGCKRRRVTDGRVVWMSGHVDGKIVAVAKLNGIAGWDLQLRLDPLPKPPAPKPSKRPRPDAFVGDRVGVCPDEVLPTSKLSGAVGTVLPGGYWLDDEVTLMLPVLFDAVGRRRSFHEIVPSHWLRRVLEEE